MREAKDEFDDWNDCEELSSPPIELILVLDPSVEFLLKSSRVHPVRYSWLLTPGS
jgi:hypothetical protein